MARGWVGMELRPCLHRLIRFRGPGVAGVASAARVKKRPSSGRPGNSRNGGTRKPVLTDHGPVRIDTPRDRKSEFEPRLVCKGPRRPAGLDEKIIALHGGGMTTREIETYISDLANSEHPVEAKVPANNPMP